MNHQCCIEWTKDATLPFRAICRCGWSSMKYRSTAESGLAADHHCRPSGVTDTGPAWERDEWRSPSCSESVQPGDCYRHDMRRDGAGGECAPAAD